MDPEAPADVPALEELVAALRAGDTAVAARMATLAWRTAFIGGLWTPSPVAAVDVLLAQVAALSGEVGLVSTLVGRLRYPRPAIPNVAPAVELLSAAARDAAQRQLARTFQSGLESGTWGGLGDLLRDLSPFRAASELAQQALRDALRGLPPGDLACAVEHELFGTGPAPAWSLADHGELIALAAEVTASGRLQDYLGVEQVVERLREAGGPERGRLLRLLHRLAAGDYDRDQALPPGRNREEDANIAWCANRALSEA